MIFIGLGKIANILIRLCIPLIIFGVSTIRPGTVRAISKRILRSWDLYSSEKRHVIFKNVRKHS